MYLFLIFQIILGYRIVVYRIKTMVFAPKKKKHSKKIQNSKRMISPSVVSSQESIARVDARGVKSIRAAPQLQPAAHPSVTSPPARKRRLKGCCFVHRNPSTIKHMCVVWSFFSPTFLPALQQSAREKDFLLSSSFLNEFIHDFASV